MSRFVVGEWYKYDGDDLNYEYIGSGMMHELDGEDVDVFRRVDDGYVIFYTQNARRHAYDNSGLSFESLGNVTVEREFNEIRARYANAEA
jgi:hypothetical protein